MENPESTLKQGNMVQIYADPTEKTGLEGEAVLLHQLTVATSFGEELWLVRFGDPGEDEVVRWVGRGLKPTTPP